MNKALFLLLITLTHSQSDGTLLPSSSELEKFDENVEDFQMKEWQTSGFPHLTDLSKNKMANSEPVSEKKRSGNDILTRRSALDKNFMRFGRDPSDSYFFPMDSSRTNFFRFGRGFKDNFIRFGRAGKDNFIRFGRGGRDGFVRVGPEDFYRSGKSIRENFIRFGRPDGYFSTKDNQFFTDSAEDEFGRTEGPHQDSFIRFGKNVGNEKERNGTKFSRFGKQHGSEEPEDGEADEKPEGCDDTRKKREMAVGKTNDGLHKKRSPGFFDETPASFPAILAVRFGPGPESLKHLKSIPFFPVLSPYSRYTVGMPETKKSLTGEGIGSGSNFIRFG